MEQQTNEDTVVEETITTEDGYTSLVKYVETLLLYKGKSIEQWAQELALPSIPYHVDRDIVLNLNRVSVSLTDTIYTNLALSKSVLTGAKSAYEKAYNTAYIKVEETFPKDEKKRLTAEARASLAREATMKEKTTLTISEFFYEFWKHQADKIEQFNTRLTSINISKHNEEKYTNNSY